MIRPTPDADRSRAVVLLPTACAEPPPRSAIRRGRPPAGTVSLADYRRQRAIAPRQSAGQLTSDAALQAAFRAMDERGRRMVAALIDANLSGVQP